MTMARFSKMAGYTNQLYFYILAINIYKNEINDSIYHRIKKSKILSNSDKFSKISASYAH